MRGVAGTATDTSTTEQGEWESEGYGGSAQTAGGGWRYMLASRRRPPRHFTRCIAFNLLPLDRRCCGRGPHLALSIQALAQ